MWALREELVPQRAWRPIKRLLVNTDRIQVPPLHIKLELMMQFANLLDNTDRDAVHREHKLK